MSTLTERAEAAYEIHRQEFLEHARVTLAEVLDLEMGAVPSIGEWRFQPIARTAIGSPARFRGIVNVEGETFGVEGSKYASAASEVTVWLHSRAGSHVILIDDLIDLATDMYRGVTSQW